MQEMLHERPINTKNQIGGKCMLNYALFLTRLPRSPHCDSVFVVRGRLRQFICLGLDLKHNHSF